MKHIVKRKGHKEMFNVSKIENTCLSSFLAGQMSLKDSKMLCAKVKKDVLKWVDGKKEITSQQIFHQVVKSIRKYNKEAAFMYETHRDLS